MYQHANKICFKCSTLLYSNLVKIALCINLRSSDLPARFTLLSASETPFFVCGLLSTLAQQNLVSCYSYLN